DIINFFGLLIMIYRHKINNDGFPQNSGMSQKIIDILYQFCKITALGYFAWGKYCHCGVCVQERV
ncbi:MAG: hypothetical protein ACOCWZ_10820, partial [Spirochaetota bacterium]